MIHNSRAFYWNRETGAHSRNPPAKGVESEMAFGDAEKFDRGFETARKHDSGELNAESKWTQYTHGDREIYWNRETTAWSLIAPAEGVFSEQVEEDAEKF